MLKSILILGVTLISGAFALQLCCHIGERRLPVQPTLSQLYSTGVRAAEPTAVAFRSRHRQNLNNSIHSAAPLPAALVDRGTSGILHREGRQRPAARLSLFRG